MRLLTFFVAACFAGALQAQDVTVPSGLDVSLFDVILEDPTQTARFRFLVPAIGGPDAVPYADITPDLQFLCDDVAIPGLAANGWDAKDIIISLSAE